MNGVAASLGEVGLPMPVDSMASRDWDAIVVGGGHNGLTAATYLARAGKSVLVLERRERLGGACTLERPFDDDRFVISPCAYVVGLLDEVVIRELGLRERGLRVFVADPNLWVPFEDGSSFGQWLDDEKTKRGLDQRASRTPTRRATGTTRSSSTRCGSSSARASATPGSETPRPAPRSRSSWVGTRDDRSRLRRVDRRGPRRPHLRRAPEDRPLRPGDHRHVGRAPGAGAPPRSSSCITRATSRARGRSGATSRAAWGW